MFVYFSFFVSLTGLIFLAGKAPLGQRNFLLLIIFAVLIVFAGLRGLVGSDTISYLNFYDQFKDPEALRNYLTKMEPIFVLLVGGHGYLLDSKLLYLIMMSCFQTWLLYLVFEKSRKGLLFLLFYILLFYLNFHFNIARAGVATMLLLLSLTTDSKKVKVLAVLMAPGFHFSVLFFYPLFFVKLDLRRFLFLAIFVIFALLLLFKNIDYFFAKYQSYLEYMQSGSSEVSLAGALIALNVLISIILLRSPSRMLLGSSLLLLLALIVEIYYSIGYRLVNMGLLFYLYFFLEYLSYRRYKWCYIFCWAPVFMVFTLSLHNMVNERSVLEARIASGESLDNALKSTYIPYEFYWQDSDVSQLQYSHSLSLD